ncbi:MULTISPECIES: aminodeoxychorismate synthase component I [unclassified Variovorax]|uniref:aminodeoxychorismate synthase component I n=1 Tax=unclassified Variovorax TaxID=663243 RepID=UPI00076C5479|nr:MULTISPECIES: aminodeoxychorismate synthase component I [unclassified Variovorax]KWT83828.1 Para-aminobenzoate synthase, aminase component [Variovorax sp. WDL1]PNG46506.1 Aminodeoxychorismate synthase component 1 [Variovorax sp. B2]PNG47672.1 Aminodeoxychorismate synthase component 1 [Variovorax sp. B4]VTV14262.1 Para-aminobenzoate synthase component 1 [Variovorax sp. WDL1]
MAPVSALIDFSSPGETRDAPRLRHAFGVPREILQARTAAEVRPLLDAVQAQARHGRWCVGYLRYEAACAFDPALAVHDPDGPLAWFGIHERALPWPGDDHDAAQPALTWDETLSRREFDLALARLREAIAAGDLYQVNYTSMLRGRLDVAAGAGPHAAARALFAALQRAQPGGYAAFIDDGEEQVLSASPELFFDWRAGRLLARPMKGTAARGATAQEDAEAAARLRRSAKERAENVMIVDLLRNDMSRLAEPFSVRVPRLFHAEALPTVWQMTSDIEARTRPGCTLADVFAALFPCGSVTGAPKVGAMRMIRALEPGPRGVYCGAVGVVRPGGDATFNVPIRTVTLRGGVARCGIGSGVVAESQPDGEWLEWQHKRAFLDRASTPFELLETLALEDGRLRDAPAHLARMAAAAGHFGYPWQELAAAQRLEALRQAHPRGHWRVRLLLDHGGRVQVQADAQSAAPQRVRLQLADRAFGASGSEFVRFKTTRRSHYEAFAPTRAGVFDTLLWNLRGELTECTRGNVALLIGGSWVTPPLACGLLGGVGRERWLREGRMAESVVRLQDLPRVEALAFVNSLRGWIDAELDPPAA